MESALPTLSAKRRRLPKPLAALAPIIAAAFVVAAAPATASAYGYPPHERVRVTEKKVKVKTCGGKAKIKDKRNGKQKIKVKGPNGEHAAAIAHQARYGAPRHAQPYHYGK